MEDYIVQFHLGIAGDAGTEANVRLMQIIAETNVLVPFAFSGDSEQTIAAALYGRLQESLLAAFKADQAELGALEPIAFLNPFGTKKWVWNPGTQQHETSTSLQGLTLTNEPVDWLLRPGVPIYLSSRRWIEA